MDNEKFQELVLAQFEKMNSRFDGIDSRFDGIDSRLDGIDSRLDGIDSRLDGLESQVKENTHILKALEHLAEVNKAEHDKTNFILARIESKSSKVDEKIDNYLRDHQFHIVAAVNE